MAREGFDVYGEAGGVKQYGKPMRKKTESGKENICIGNEGGRGGGREGRREGGREGGRAVDRDGGRAGGRKRSVAWPGDITAFGN